MNEKELFQSEIDELTREIANLEDRIAFLRGRKEGKLIQLGKLLESKASPVAEESIESIQRSIKAASIPVTE